MVRTLFIILFMVLPTVSFGSTVLLLKDGGTLEGELLNPDEINRKLYRVKAAEGFEISLDAALVEKIQNRERPALIEYNATAPLTPNTLENHLYWAKWCNEQQLSDQAKVHLRQIIEIDPDNAYARSLLGYVKDSKDTAGWVNLQEKSKNNGLIEHKGHWKTEYQIEVENLLENREKLNRYWLRTIRTLCQKLPNEQAEAELLQIRDPAAVHQLGEALRAEVNPQKRIVLIRSLVQIGSPAAFQIVASWSVSINEPSEDIRLMCADELRKRLGERPEIRSIMVGIYRECLNPNMPPIIIRMAAKRLGDIEGYEAIPQLIDVLAFTVTESVQPQTPTYTTGGGKTGLSQGGKPQKVSIPVMNQEVLATLCKLTGMNFAYNQAAWQEWYRQTQRSPISNANLRRM